MINNFVALDLETATADRSSICQIGITEVVNGVIQPSKSWLVQPEGNNYDSINVAIHGIYPEDTIDSPSFPIVWKIVEPYLSNKIVVAHNTSFDMYALRNAFDKYKIDYPNFEYFCTLRLSKYIIKGCYSYSLDILLDYLGIEFGEHHKADSDSLGCAKLLIKCLELEGASLGDLETKYNFHRGKFAPGVFVAQLQNEKPSESYNSFISKLNVTNDTVDETNYFYAKRVCFTGTCQFGTRKELLKKIADIGGIPTDSVTADTDVLIVGQQDYRLVGDSGMSSKQKKAMKLLEMGKNIEILSESEFFSRF